MLQGGCIIPPNSADGTLVKASIIRPSRPDQDLDGRTVGHSGWVPLGSLATVTVRP